MGGGDAISRVETVGRGRCDSMKGSPVYSLEVSQSHTTERNRRKPSWTATVRSWASDSGRASLPVAFFYIYFFFFFLVFLIFINYSTMVLVKLSFLALH